MVILFTGVAAAGLLRFNDFAVGSFTVSASLQAAIVAIGLREGAYMGEIIRNGLQSVSKGQVEAARALGMSPMRVMWKIIIPQAMRVIVPPFGNDFNVMLKVTSLASVIGVPELFLTTQTFSAENFRVFELFIGLAINYLLLTTAWSVIQSLIEARLRRHESTAGRISFLRTVQAHLIGTGATDTGSA
jgi:polar amino acid transport system permease protein